MRTRRALIAPGALILALLAGVSLLPACSQAATLISPEDGAIFRPGQKIHFEWMLDAGERGARFFAARSNELSDPIWTMPLGDGSRLITSRHPIMDISIIQNPRRDTYSWRLCVAHDEQPDDQCTFSETRHYVIPSDPVRRRKGKRRHHHGSRRPASSVFLPKSKAERIAKRAGAWFVHKLKSDGAYDSYVASCGRLSARVVDCMLVIDWDDGFECRMTARVFYVSRRSHRTRVTFPDKPDCHGSDNGDLDPGGDIGPTRYEILRFTFRAAAGAATSELWRVITLPPGAWGLRPSGCIEVSLGVVDCGVVYYLSASTGKTECRSTVRWYGKVTNGKVAPVVYLPGTKFDLAPFTCGPAP